MPHGEGAAPDKTWLSSYGNGFMVAVSPGNIVFWLSVFGTLLADRLGSTGQAHFWTMAAGVICGIAIHDVVLMLLVTHARRLIDGKWMKRVSIGATGVDVFRGHVRLAVCAVPAAVSLNKRLPAPRREEPFCVSQGCPAPFAAGPQQSAA